MHDMYGTITGQHAGQLTLIKVNALKERDSVQLWDYFHIVIDYTTYNHKSLKSYLS
jgi:hypothetical protein